MLFFGIKNLWFRIGIFTILSAWVLTFVYLIYQNYYITDPFDPTLAGTKQYGHNAEGAFGQIAVFLLVEYLILLATLLPFSFSRFYWLRVLILQIVFGGWAFLLILAVMHSGGVYIIHLLAMVIINVILFVLLIVSGIAEIINRRKISRSI